jgi:hypothetical protein
VTTWPINIACWIPKATNTHSEYIILIAFHSATLFARTPFCGCVWVGLYMNIIGGIPYTLIEFVHFAYI